MPIEINQVRRACSIVGASFRIAHVESSPLASRFRSSVTASAGRGAEPWTEGDGGKKSRIVSCGFFAFCMAGAPPVRAPRARGSARGHGKVPKA